VALNDQRTISEMGIISDEVYDNDPSGVKYFKDNPETMLVDTHFGITAYTVIDCTSTDTNMQALLLQKSGTNEYVIAFRGTEMETWSSWGGDVLEDLVIGLNNYSSQYSDALDFVQSALNDPKYSEYNITTDNLTLTGHSLGGILTQAVGAVLGIESYAFNPYGTERLLTMPPNIGGAAGLLDVYRYAIFNAFGLDSSYAESAKENVLNIMYSDFGALNGDILSNLATALTSEHLGEMLPIFGDNVGLDGHYISVVNKAIQHYNETLAHFTDTTTMESLSRVYLLSGENGYDKVEAVFTDLNVLGAADHSLSLNILAGTDSEGNSTPLCPDDLETQARSDIAYRYALVNLNPFVVVGADYSSFNQNGELDIYNPGTGQGRLSDEYITHRSEMLSLLIERNINDYSDSSIYFEDKTTGEIVTRPDLNAPLERTVVFGSEQRDELEGSGPTDERPNQGDRDDFLFGMGGNDTLKGYGGDDYLEGGNGEDTLIGGEGNDILDGGQGDDIYRFAPGDGNDTIRDSDGAGTIVITDVAGNIVEIASGDFTRTDSSSDTWTSSSGNITLTQGASWVLTLSDGSTITLETFEDGYFGINLKDVSVSDPTPPQTTLDIIGDYAPVDADPDEEGIQYSYDDLGNVVTDPGSSEEREDVIYDSEGNDFISSGAGDDTIRLKRGGDDVVETGDGDDTVRKSMDGNVNIALGEGDDYFRVYNNSAGQVVAEGGKGRDYLGGSLDNDILIGGTEADCLHGAGGDDLLYGDAQGNAADFIVTGATQEASGTQGELADAEDGNDQIFTGAGDDFITAGDGNDLIVSGGGDDYIRGDGNIYVPAGADWQDWAVTETVTTDESGSTYTYNYSGLVTEGNSGAGNDTIYAGAGNDVVFGESGADTIYLEAGNDNAWGGAGSDTLLGGDGDDLLNGDNGITELAEALHGDDFLDGGDGNDTLEGMGGSDILYGGAGDDTLSGDSSTQIEGGNDYLNGEAGSDVLYGGLGDDTLVGGSGNDSLSGGSGADDLQGGADDDVLYGGSGDDFLSGGTENDDLYGDEGDAGDDELQGAGGADKLYGGEDNDLLFGQEGEDLLDGGSGNDELQGGSDNDILIGGSGEDTLLGGSGADDLRGGADDDVLSGGSGNDFLSGGTENDLLYGDEGDDILYGDAGDDELQGAGGADKLYGGEDNDLLFGQEGEDFLDGGSGNDELQGGSDNDILIGGSGEDTLLGGSGADDLRGGADDDVLSGGSGDDSLSGGTENDLLYGDEGDDVLYGGSGSDRLFGDLYDQTGIGNDILYGDAGDDELQGAGGADKLYGGEDNDLLGGQEGEDLLDGGSGNDELQGGADNDILIGGSGDDKLYGDDGNDALVGGAGVDYMVGGKGEDTYSFSLGDSLFNGDTSDMDTLKDLYGQTILEFDETVNLSDLTARFDESQNVYLQYSENDTLKIERGLLYQGILIRIADTEITLRDLVQPVLTEDIDLQGDTFDNTLSGGIGDDTLSGGQGSDTYYYYKDSATDTIIDSTGVNGTDSNTIIFGDGITSEDIHLTLTSSRQLQLIVGNDTANSIIIDNFNADDIYHNPPIQTFIFADGTSLSYEQLLGRGFDLTGDDGADYWLGTNGDDRIIGGKGNDFLSGGAGSDTYFYNLGDGQDIIDNADSDITSVDTLSFGEGINPDDLYLGRSGNDLVVKIGNTTDFIAIHNHFTDGSMDQFVFADGTVWDALGITDQLVKRLTEGTDTYIGSYADEIVQAYGGDDILYGEGGDDSLSGGEGNDFLDGGQGDDLLDGGAGNDILTGGEGSNVLDGGAGDDVYVLMGHNEAGTDIVNDLNPQVTTDVITDSEGIDTVEFGTPEDFMGHLLDYHPGYVSALNIVFCWENGFLTVYYGNEFQNKVTLQDAEVEYFKAADGSIISLEEVEAVLGKIASQLGKPVSDVSAAEIYSNPELTLMIYQAWDRSEVTGEGLHTSEGFEVIGTAESQIIAGRENADGLTGYQGNDLLAGFEGNDVLVGGSGDDVYVFGKGWGHDRVSDSIPDGLLSSSEYYGFFMNRYNLPDDYASDSGGQDTLVFLDDIQLNDLQGYWNGSWQAWGNVGLDDLIIRVGTEGDAVLIADYYAGDIETLRLAAEDRNLTAQDILDLMVTDDADLLRGVDWAENSLAGAGGNDAILGGVLADCLAGGEGEDFLNGGMGDDNYVVSLGDGRDMIKDGNYDLESETYAELRYWKGRTEWVIEYGAYGQQDDFPDEAGDAGGVDSINFGEDIGIQDVAFSRFEYGAYSKFDGLKTYDRLYAGYGPLMEKIAGDSILSALGSADHFNFSQGSDLTSVTNQMAYENDIYLPNQYIEGHAVEDFILTDGSQITFDDINQGLDESAAYIAANQDALTTIEESGRDAKGYVDQILLNKWHRVDQTVNGTASSEQIVAGDGDDTITAGDGADVIDAGFGSDWIDGGSGDDVYIYNRWDGSDTIYDSGGADRLQLGDDIRLDDLIIQLDPATGDLFIGIVDEVEKLTTEAAGGVYEPDVQSLSQKIILKNWSNPDARVETLQLADGTAYNLAELVGGLQVDDYSLSGEEDQLMTGVVAVDSNSNDITFSLSQDATNGTFALNDDGSWTYLPENNYFGYDKVIVEVTDNSGQSVFSQIDLTINPVNDAPIFSENHKAYELMGLMTAEGTVSASDVDGDPLTYSLVKGPDHGQLLMGEDGQWVYQAEEGFSGFDTATVMAVDGQEGSAEQTLDFSVNVYHEGDLTLDDVMPERLLLHGISSSDLDFSRHDSDLEITIRDRGIVTVKNYFVSTEQSLAWLQTMEGQISLSKSSIETSSGGWLPVEYFSGSDAENDLQFGSWRLDVMRGKEGNDILFGAGGIDTLWGGHGSDTLIGGDGNDLLYGDSGNDALYGGVDADVLVGGDGDDLLIGGGGIDVLTAGSGQDHLAGGVGNDILTGGSGDDTYIFHRGDGRDRLYDESGTDAILFDEDVSSVGIALFKADNTLQIGYGIDDVITLNNVSDSTTGNRIEAITLANGSTMTDADINQIIQEMSAYATAEGIAMDSLADVRQNEELMAIVASGWQAA